MPRCVFSAISFKARAFIVAVRPTCSSLISPSDKVKICTPANCSRLKRVAVSAWSRLTRSRPSARTRSKPPSRAVAADNLKPVLQCVDLSFVELLHQQVARERRPQNASLLAVAQTAGQGGERADVVSQIKYPWYAVLDVNQCVDGMHVCRLAVQMSIQEVPFAVAIPPVTTLPLNRSCLASFWMQFGMLYGQAAPTSGPKHVQPQRL